MYALVLGQNFSKPAMWDLKFKIPIEIGVFDLLLLVRGFWLLVLLNLDSQDKDP